MSDSAKMPAVARTVWPTVVGVLSMVLAGEGLLRMVPSALFWYGTSLRMTVSAWVQVGQLALSAVLYVLLLTAGFAVMKRMRTGLVLLALYTVCRLTMVVAIIAMALVEFSPGYRGAGDLATMTLYVLVRSVIHLWFPSFLIVWFARPSVWREVRSWRGPPPMSEPAGAATNPFSRPPDSGE